MGRRIIYTKVVEIVDDKPTPRVVVHHNHHHRPKPQQPRLPDPKLEIEGESPSWLPPLIGLLLFIAVVVIGKILGS